MVRQARQTARVGVAENGNSAFLVTVAPDGGLLDRRYIDLTDHGMPTHPHHHEGSWAVGRYLNTPGARAMSLADAVALVEKVRVAAAHGAHGARAALGELATAVPVPIAAISLRVCPQLPATVEERITDHRAQTYADTVMYRQALANAATARGWSVHWYDRDQVFDAAAKALNRRDIKTFLTVMGQTLGPPGRRGTSSRPPRQSPPQATSNSIGARHDFTSVVHRPCSGPARASPHLSAKRRAAGSRPQCRQSGWTDAPRHQSAAPAAGDAVVVAARGGERRGICLCH
jgi:hypothetical protein